MMSFNVDYAVAAPAQIIADIGQKLEQARLSRNITQKQLAEKSGLSISTVKRLEQGDSATLDSLVRAMGALGLRSNLGSLVPGQAVRPVERVKLKGHERQRARPKLPSKSSVKNDRFAWGNAGVAE